MGKSDRIFREMVYGDNDIMLKSDIGKAVFLGIKSGKM